MGAGRAATDSDALTDPARRDSVLSGIAGLAARNDALDRNPVRDAGRITNARKKALTALTALPRAGVAGHDDAADVLAQVDRMVGLVEAVLADQELARVLLTERLISLHEDLAGVRCDVEMLRGKVDRADCVGRSPLDALCEACFACSWRRGSPARYSMLSRSPGGSLLRASWPPIRPRLQRRRRLAR